MTAPWPQIDALAASVRNRERSAEETVRTALERSSSHEDLGIFLHVDEARALRGDLPNFSYAYRDRAWSRNGESIKLPKSRKHCMRRLHIKAGKVTLTF